MTPQEFCYWLRGYTEIADNVQPSVKQWSIICDHLDLVFTKVTPTTDIDKLAEQMADGGRRALYGPPAMDAATQRRLCGGKLPTEGATYCTCQAKKDDDGVIITESVSRTC